MRALTAATLVLTSCSLAAPLAPGPGDPRGRASAGVTFNQDVAPILFRNCATCHRPGGAGPFSVLNYAEARRHATQIADVTRRRFMPPWLPAAGYGEFAGERRLGDHEIETLAQWVRGGAPEGSADPPSPPRFEVGWPLGEPDLVLRMPEPYTLPAGGADVFRNFVLPVPLGTTRYVRALEIRPGNSAVVHHANVLVDRTRSSRRLDALDPEPGFAGMDLRLESDVFDPDSHFLFWKPGTAPAPEPDDMAWTLDPGSDLVLNMHLQPSGRPEAVEAEVGLYFTDAAPTRFPMLLQLENDAALDIPPGAADFAVADDLELPLDVDVLAVYPHAHYLGKRLEAFATLPDGTRKPLVLIPRWDLNWQAVYLYREPVFLPRGTTVSMRFSYDNSPDNPSNPSDPPRRVSGGNRATDEMAHLWLQVVPRGDGVGRVVLQEALARHRLARNPHDVAARFNLGSVLLLRGRPDEALREFEAALAVDPGHATVRNSHATVLESQGRYAEAAAEFREVLRIDPDAPDARYNLANCLAAQGEFEEAVEHFRLVAWSHPDDAAARDHLTAALQEAGNALLSAGQAGPAEDRYREALALRPDDAGIHNDLGSALLALGDLAEAVAEFERALDLDPRNDVARENLAVARAKLPSR
jgi:tetratricopeptide (TPR) repeat protein/mono/diheme cytochrome c family protein